MRGYQALWWSVTSPLSVLGILVALHVVPGLLVLLMVVCVLTISGQVRAIRAGLRRPGNGGSRPLGRPATAAAVAGGAAAAAGATALLGLAILLGWTVAVPLGLLLVASSPSAVQQYRSRRTSRAATPDARQVTRSDDPTTPAAKGGQPVPPDPTAVLGASPDPVAQLTVDQLCLRWRCSYLPLQHTVDCAAHAELVRQRQHYLDELERRHPDAFARWLAAGARAASDPSPYFPTPGRAGR